jgi:hypothetical protein
VAVGVTHSVTVGSSSWAVVGKMKARVKETERIRRDRIVVGLGYTLVCGGQWRLKVPLLAERRC